MGNKVVLIGEIFMSDPEVATNIWSKLSLNIPVIISFLGLTASYVFTLGRLKEKMLTKKDFGTFCKQNQTVCSGRVVLGIAELKTLVVDLHKDQSRKIEAMDNKREKAKDFNHEEIKKLTASIGRLEGHMEFYVNKFK